MIEKELRGQDLNLLPSGEPIEDIEGVVPPEEYEDLKAQLKRLAVQSGKNLTDVELDQLLQKLLYPLDRP